MVSIDEFYAARLHFSVGQAADAWDLEGSWLDL